MADFAKVYTLDDTITRDTKASLDSIAETAKKTGETIVNAFGQKMTREMANLTKKANDLKTRLEELDKEMEKVQSRSIVDPIAVAETEKKIAEVKASLKDVRKEMTALEKENGGTVRSYSDIVEAIRTLPELIKDKKLNLVNSDNIDKDMADIKKLEAELKKLEDIKRVADEASQEARIQSYEDQSTNQLQHYNPTSDEDAEAYRQEIERIVEARKEEAKAIAEIQKEQEARVKGNYTPPEKEESEEDTIQSYEELVERINDLRDSIAGLRETAKGAGKEPLKYYEEEIKAEELELKKLEAMRKVLDGKETKTKPEPPQKQTETTEDVETRKTQSLVDVLKESIKLKAQLGAQRMSLLTTDDVQGTMANISAIENRIKELQGVFNNIKESPLATVGSALQSLATNGLQKVGSIAKTAGSALLNFTTRGLSMIASGAKAALSSLASLASRGFNAIKNGAKGAVSGISSLMGRMKSFSGNTTQKMMRSLSGIKSMLMRRVKRQFISEIFNNAKQGLQNLAKYSSEFNNSMSSIKNSAKTTAGNLSVTFGNLITALAPAITAVTSMINTVIVKINELFALLSGKTTVTTAKQATDDYAKSLKSAGGAAKDLNHQLYGFDEITRQEDNSGGGGGGGASGQIEYVESAISDFAQRIYDAIAAGKWEEAGTLIGEKINGIVSTAREKLQELEPVCVEWASNIARLLNGLTDEVDFGEIGGLFGDGFNLVFSTLDTFLSTYHWGTLGAKLADGMNGMFSTIRWGTIGKTFADGFDALFLTISNFAANAKWSEYGSKLAEAVTSFFDNIDIEVAADAIAESLNGIVTLFTSFMDGVNWPFQAFKIMTGLDLMVSKIDFPAIRNLISNGINTLIDVFHTIVTSDTMIHLAGELGELVGGILNDIHWEQLALDVRVGLWKIATGFTSFVTKLQLPNIAKRLAAGVNTFFAADGTGKTPFATVAGVVSTGINEIIEGFKVLLSDENGINFGQIREDLVGGINTLLAETDWDDLVTTVITGVGRVTTEFFKLVSGIMNPVDEAGNATESLGTKLSNAINNVFKDEKGKIDLTMFKDLGTSIGDAIKGVFENLSDFITGVNWETVGKSIATALENIDWIGIGEAIINFIGSAMLAAVKLADGLIGNAIRNLLGLKSNIDTFNATGVKWAEELSGGMEKEMQSNSTKERMLSAAAAMATGLTDSSTLGLMEESSNKCAKWFVGGLTKASTWEQMQTDFAHAGWDIADSLAKGLFSSLDGLELSADELYNTIYSAESSAEIYGKFHELGIGIPIELADALYNSREPVVQAAEQLLLDLENASTMEEVKQAFSDAGLTITDALADSLKGQGAENISAALTLMAMGVDEATIAAMDMTHLSENLNAYMKDSKSDLASIATELGAEVGNGVGYTIPAAIAEALGIGKEEVKRVKGEMVDEATVSASEVSSGEQSGKDLGSGVAENTAEGIEEKTDEVETATQTMGEAITTKLSELPEKERKQAETMMNLILEGIKEGDPLVQEAIESAANAVVARAQEILASSVGYDIAMDFLTGMHSAMVANADGIIGTMGTMANYAVQRANVIMSESNGYTIGSNVVIGMHNGMGDFGHYVVDKMVEICEAAIQTARNAFDINSPSKVFAEIGGYVMEGMDNGLEDTGREAIRTVGDIASRIIDEGSSAGQIDASLGFMMNGLDTVESKMSRIAQIFSDIGDVIADMGGLEIPTVASGKVLPYRARVDTSTSTETNTLMNGDIESALYSALTRALSELDLNMTTNLNLDGRKMTEVVTRYQRQNERAMGV